MTVGVDINSNSMLERSATANGMHATDEATHLFQLRHVINLKCVSAFSWEERKSKTGMFMQSRAIDVERGDNGNFVGL